MKAFLLSLMICGSAILIGGCWDRVEVNDLAIVTAAGIDKKDDQGIELHLQVFIPSSINSGSSGVGGSGGGSKKEAATMVRSQIGTNISDALSKLQGKVPRKIFWGQCKVFMFGEELAKDGIQESLDFLLRHPELRERAYVYVNEGDPKVLLESSPTLESYSGEVVRALSDMRIGMRVTMKDLNEMLISETQAAVLPYLKVLEQKKAESVPYIIGTAVFKQDKMIGKLMEKETRGLLWLRDEIQSYTVTFQPAGSQGNVSLSPVTEKVRLIPKIHNDSWKMVVKIDTVGSVLQNGTDLDLLDLAALDMIEKAFKEDIEQRVALAIKQAQLNLKVDIVNFGKEFHRKYPRQWKHIENRWDTKFPEVEVQLDITAGIRRQGYIRNLNEQKEE